MAAHAERPGSHVEQLRADIDDRRPNSDLTVAYRRFLAINAQFKELCGAWQLFNGKPNDHSSAEIRRRGHREPVAPPHSGRAGDPAFGATFERMDGYGPRLESVLIRILDGESNMFTGVMCGSYHDVWMELHEDLILTQGLDRDLGGQLLMARFGRVLTAMVTPFDADGELNVDAAVRLAQWLVEQGNEGLVVCGTTGESADAVDRREADAVRDGGGRR